MPSLGAHTDSKAVSVGGLFLTRSKNEANLMLEFA
jgi:hypothetical protein